jgi:hypothetical protein
MKELPTTICRSRTTGSAPSILIVNKGIGHAERIPFDGPPEVLFSKAENIPPEVIEKKNRHDAGKTIIQLSGRSATATWLYFRQSILCAVIKWDTLPDKFVDYAVCRLVYPVEVHFYGRTPAMVKMADGSIIKHCWDSACCVGFDPALRCTGKFFAPLRDFDSEISRDEEDKIKEICERELNLGDKKLSHAVGRGFPAALHKTHQATASSRRGRPSVCDWQADKRILAAWQTGHHHTHAELATALNKKLSAITLALDRAKKREKRAEIMKNK